MVKTTLIHKILTALHLNVPRNKANKCLNKANTEIQKIYIYLQLKTLKFYYQNGRSIN